MSEEMSMGQNSLRLLYYRYKDSSYFVILTITVIVVACTFIIYQIIIPQIENWFSIRNEVIATRNRIDVINKNISFMNNVDKVRLDNQVEVVTSALPLEKNFGAIVGALSDAAVASGVSLDDFAFQVGNIASVSGQQVSIDKDLSLVKLSVSVGGGVDNIELFIKAIGEKLPLSEVTDVEGDQTSTTITLQFYQKAFPHIVFKDDQPLSPIPDTYVTLLNKLAEWKPIASDEDTSVSSGSAIPLF